MKKKISIIIFLGLILFISCKDDNPIKNDKIEQIVQSDKKLFHYELIGTAPIHTQSVMLTGGDNKLYRFGSRSPVQILDLNTLSWSMFELPDSTFWRWDGATITYNNVIYIVATSDISNSILRFNLETSIMEHTTTHLPAKFHYPAYCENNGLIIFLSKGSINTFEYRINKDDLKEITKNPFYTEKDLNQTLSSGKYGDYFYVFGGYPDLSENLFYRLNLSAYTWEQIDVPEELRRKNLHGSVLDRQFIFLSDSLSTYSYSLDDQSWIEDTTKTPIPSLGYDAEWSFYSDGATLFGTNIITENVWAIKYLK